MARCLRAQREKLEREQKKHFQLVHFSIQDDHLHLIVEATDKRGLARGVMGLEIRIAKRINKALQRKGRFWSDRYHRHDLRTPSETRNALRYVLLNVQKHYRVFGDRAFADPFSSATTFDGFARAPTRFENAVDWAAVPHLAARRRVAPPGSYRPCGRAGRTLFIAAPIGPEWKKQKVAE